MYCNTSDSLYSVFLQAIRFHYYRTHTLLDKLGIYPGQPPLLFSLAKQDGQSQKELAQKLHLKASTIAIMLKRMEKSKLVERRIDEKDQRITRVYLSEYGKEVLKESKEIMKVIEDECFSNFTHEEQVLLRRFLIQMRDNLENACGNNGFDNI